MRFLLCAVAALLATAARADEHPLAVLSARAAEAVATVAAGRPVEVDLPEDRSAVTGASQDVRALLDALLKARAGIPADGPRLRFSSVLGRSATRVRLVGRVTDVSSGALVALISVSAEVEPDVVALLAPGRIAASTGGVSLSARGPTTPLSARVLDLAFVGGDRVLVLTERAVLLYRLEPTGFVRLDERPLRVESVVRAPAGILLASPAEKAAWAATNRAPGAALFSIEGDRLSEGQRAAALPWPEGSRAAAFREGTNLVEAEVRDLGKGPHLRIGAAPKPWAVAPDGRLGMAGIGWTDARVGSAAVELWPGAFLASSPEAPGASDWISFLRVSGEGPGVPSGSLPVNGTVRAIAARAGDGESATAVVALTAEGEERLMVVEVRNARR